MISAWRPAPSRCRARPSRRRTVRRSAAPCDGALGQVAHAEVADGRAGDEQHLPQQRPPAGERPARSEGRGPRGAVDGRGCDNDAHLPIIRRSRSRMPAPFGRYPCKRCRSRGPATGVAAPDHRLLRTCSPNPTHAPAAGPAAPSRRFALAASRAAVVLALAAVGLGQRRPGRRRRCPHRRRPAPAGARDRGLRARPDDLGRHVGALPEGRRRARHPASDDARPALDRAGGLRAAAREPRRGRPRRAGAPPPGRPEGRQVADHRRARRLQGDRRRRHGRAVLAIAFATPLPGPAGGLRWTAPSASWLRRDRRGARPGGSRASGAVGRRLPRRIRDVGSRSPTERAVLSDPRAARTAALLGARRRARPHRQPRRAPGGVRASPRRPRGSPSP